MIYTVTIDVDETVLSHEKFSPDSTSLSQKHLSDWECSKHYWVLWGEKEGIWTESGDFIHDCMFVVHFCKNQFLCCVENSSASKHSFQSFPKINPHEQRSLHLYRISPKVYPKPRTCDKSKICENVAKRLKRQMQ